MSFTVELGVFVPYPEDGKDAKDHRRPSALQRTQTSFSVMHAFCHKTRSYLLVKYAISAISLSVFNIPDPGEQFGELKYLWGFLLPVR